MFRSLINSYSQSFESTDTSSALRIVCPANLIHLVVFAGIYSTKNNDVDCCAATVFSSVFQVRSIRLSHLRCTKLVFYATGVHATIHRRKGKSVRRLLVLRYRLCPSWDYVNPVALFQKWLALHPDLDSGLCLSLTQFLYRSLSLINASAPLGCCYTSHSPRIGGYIDLMGLQYPKEWIIWRLDLESESMLYVYMNNYIFSTAH